MGCVSVSACSARAYASKVGFGSVAARSARAYASKVGCGSSCAGSLLTLALLARSARAYASKVVFYLASLNSVLFSLNSVLFDYRLGKYVGSNWLKLNICFVYWDELEYFGHPNCLNSAPFNNSVPLVV